MFDCFREKPKPIFSKPENPVDTIGPVNGTPFAFIVGHNKISQGAVNYLGESEFSFNSRIAEKAKQKLAALGVRSMIVFRPTGSYSSQVEYVADLVSDHFVKHAFCLHFNASGISRANGCEVLIRQTENKDDELVADFITDRINEKFGIKERRNDGVFLIYRGHNGFGMLDALHKVSVVPVIVEPCFATNREEAKKIFEHEDDYVDILVEAAFKLSIGEMNDEEESSTN